MEPISIISSLVIAIISAVFSVWLDKNWPKPKLKPKPKSQPIIEKKEPDSYAYPDLDQYSRRRLGRYNSPLKPKVEPKEEEPIVEESLEIIEPEQPVLRIAVVSIIGFLTALFCAFVGEELGGTEGAIIGIVSGLLLSLLAGWAAYKTAIPIAKGVSILALVVIVFLVLSGILFGLGRLIDMPFKFIDAMMCVGVLFLLGIGGLVSIFIKM